MPIKKSAEKILKYSKKFNIGYPTRTGKRRIRQKFFLSSAAAGRCKAVIIGGVCLCCGFLVGREKFGYREADLAE